jgi:uncharacterized DUF497 family protein
MRFDDIVWTAAVREKVEGRHGLAIEEVESAMFDRRARIKRAARDRYGLLGRSSSGAYITVFYAYEKRIARVITARRMDLRERRLYRR